MNKRSLIAVGVHVGSVTGCSFSFSIGDDTCADFADYSNEDKQKAVDEIYERDDPSADNPTADDPSLRLPSLEAYCVKNPDDKLSSLTPD